MAVKPIPEGYHTVTPYLSVEGADRLLEFLQRAFGAKVVEHMAMPDGKVAHAEVRIGDSIVMLGEASAEWKPVQCMLYLYVNDADATYKSALRAGGTSLREPTNMFYGDRSGGVRDFAGNQWWISTHVEVVPPEELKKRVAAAIK